MEYFSFSRSSKNSLTFGANYVHIILYYGEMLGLVLALVCMTDFLYTCTSGFCSTTYLFSSPFLTKMYPLLHSCTGRQLTELVLFRHSENSILIKLTRFCLFKRIFKIFSKFQKAETSNLLQMSFSGYHKHHTNHIYS